MMGGPQSIAEAVKIALARGQTVAEVRALQRFLLAPRAGERALALYVERGCLPDLDDDARVPAHAVGRLLPIELAVALEQWPRADQPCRAAPSPTATTPIRLNVYVVRSLEQYGLLEKGSGGDYWLTDRGRKVRGMLRTGVAT